MIKTIELLIYLLLIPLFGGLYLGLSHFYSESFIADKFLPFLISFFLILYLGRQHLDFWDKSFFDKRYLPFFTLLTIVLFLALQVFVLVTVDLNEWYSGLSYRSAIFYIFPLIFSGYVVPFLMFSHVLADSLSYSKRIIYIVSAWLITVICFLFWMLKTNVI